MWNHRITLRGWLPLVRNGIIQLHSIPGHSIIFPGDEAKQVDLVLVRRYLRMHLLTRLLPRLLLSPVLLHRRLLGLRRVSVDDLLVHSDPPVVQEVNGVGIAAPGRRHGKDALCGHLSVHHRPARPVLHQQRVQSPLTASRLSVALHRHCQRQRVAPLPQSRSPHLPAPHVVAAAVPPPAAAGAVVRRVARGSRPATSLSLLMSPRWRPACAAASPASRRRAAADCAAPRAPRRPGS